jgi:predicted nucleic acid-binding protein
MGGIKVLLDTGPLVAYLNRADQYHQWAKRCWTALHDPLSTCLVRMAELANQCQVFTTDRDFLLYRRKGRQVIPLLAPFAI